VPDWVWEVVSTLVARFFQAKDLGNGDRNAVFAIKEGRRLKVQFNVKAPGIQPTDRLFSKLQRTLDIIHGHRTSSIAKALNHVD
jgi:hypothetical protein